MRPCHALRTGRPKPSFRWFGPLGSQSDAEIAVGLRYEINASNRQRLDYLRNCLGSASKETLPSFQSSYRWF